jgi:hypothetical protein
MTKSGQIGGNFSLSSCLRLSQRLLLTQATSGERSPPLGKRKIVEELKTLPSFVSLFQ